MNINSIEELHSFAQTLIDSNTTMFLLYGNLGVGKTQFTKEVVDILGGDKNMVQSPTYTYMNTYNLPNNISLLHIDMYRFETQEDAFAKGIFEAIQEHDYVCIERPKREDQYLQHDSVRLYFSFAPEGHRQVEIKS